MPKFILGSRVPKSKPNVMNIDVPVLEAKIFGPKSVLYLLEAVQVYVVPNECHTVPVGGSDLDGLLGIIQKLRSYFPNYCFLIFMSDFCSCELFLDYLEKEDFS